VKIPFPPVEHADEHGIVWAGGKLSVENLLNAYARGIFPWPHEGLPLLWFCPEDRGVMNFAEFRVPRTVQKELRRAQFKITFDKCFEKVIEECSKQKRSGQRGTWITAEMKSVYTEMFSAGHAHSVECWSGDGATMELVGGLYGVYVQGVFSGESMFHKQTAASKQCVVALVEALIKMGHEWFDIQMVTPVLEIFGGSYMEREKYLERLQATQKRKINWRIDEN
jgi:leucyl/phenylalanyl-tRNA---protein transferase